MFPDAYTKRENRGAQYGVWWCLLYVIMNESYVVESTKLLVQYMTFVLSWPLYFDVPSTDSHALVSHKATGG